MAYYRTKRGALFIGVEDSWGAGSSSLDYVKTKEVTIPMGMEYNDPENITQSDVEDQGSVLYQPGDISFKMGLHPYTTTWPTAKPSILLNPPVSKVLAAILGGTKAGGYGVTTTGNSTTVLQFDPYGDTPTDLGFVEGEPVWVRESGATNVLGANVIDDVDDVAFTISLRSPLPSAPGDASIVYGGFCNPKLATSEVESQEVKWLGEATTDVRQCLAAIANSASIEAPYRGLAELTVGFRSARPVPPDIAESGGAPADQAYSYPEASQVLFGGLYIWDGSENRKITGGVSIDFGIDAIDIPGIHGTDPNGIADIILASRKIRVKIKPAYVDNDLIDMFQNPPASMVLTGWWGRGAASWMFQVPAGILVSPPNWTDEGGAIHHELEIGTGAYSGDTGTGGATDAADKPFVIGMLAG
jgi:hypothetical protein